MKLCYTLNHLALSGMDINSQNERGHTALHVAAKEGHVLLTQWLLSHGADPDAGNGTHPLDVAHAYSKFQISLNFESNL